MVCKCSVFACRSGCRNSPGVGEDGEKIAFHSFPIGNPALCEKWVRAIGRKDFFPTKHSKLCSLHFNPSDFIQEYRDTNVQRRKKFITVSGKPKRKLLKDDVVPSVFPNAPTGNYLSKLPLAPRESSRATLSNSSPEEIKLESLEKVSQEIDDVTSLTLTEVGEQLKDLKMPHKCCVPNCRGNYDKTKEHAQEKVSVFRFPSDPELRTKWLRLIPREGLELSDRTVVCEKHFLPESVLRVDSATRADGSILTVRRKYPKLAADAYPCLFLNNSSYLFSEPPKKRRSLSSCKGGCISAGDDDVSHTNLPEIQDEIVKETSKGFQITVLKGIKGDIPLKRTGTGEHFTSIAETLEKYRKNGFLCDAVLVAKCGGELKAHSALLTAVSPVFLMAIEEKHSSAPYHLCFPEVELDVLEIAVHFVYTGKLLLPRIYSHMDQMSMLFDKLSDLGLGMHKLHECEMTFMRSARQPSNSSEFIKTEVTDDGTSLKESMQTLQASCESPVDQTSSSADSCNQVLIDDVAQNDSRTSLTRKDSEEGSLCNLAMQKGLRNRDQERPKLKRRRAGDKNEMKGRMSRSALVPTGFLLAKLVMGPALSMLKSPVFELNQPTTGVHSSSTDPLEPNNLPVVLLDQNLRIGNALDSGSYGVHDAIVNSNGELNSQTHGGILIRVDPSATEGTLVSHGVDKLSDVTSSSGNQAYKCQLCKEPNFETFATELRLLWHKIRHHWDECSVCTYCGRKLSSGWNMRQHIKRHLGIYPRKNHKCNDCGLHFVTPAQLKSHRLRHTGEKPHECPCCKKRYTLQENMERHQLLHTVCHPFLCDFCGKGFTRKAHLTNHVTLHHDFECAVCSSKQTSKADMEKHAFEVHQISEVDDFSSIIKNPTPYLCDHCGKNCISATSLRYHMKQHRKKRVNCETCEKAFSDSSQLRLHMMRHTGERPFVCYVCQKGFTQKHTLALHLTMHSGIKPFDCVVCSNSFASQSQLNQHMKRHTMTPSERKVLLKQFTCGICNKQFTCKASVIEHHRIHTGERPYKCKICDKQFTANSTLTIHIRTHTGYKPFVCTLCAKSFVQSQHLSRHMRVHTGEKPFACEICSKSYKNKTDLRIHVTRYHKIDGTSKLLSENIEIDRKINVSDVTDTSAVVA